MNRLSNIAYHCWADTETDPTTALLVVEDGVYFDHYLYLEAKRNRFRKFYNRYFSKEEVVTYED